MENQGIVNHYHSVNHVNGVECENAEGCDIVVSEDQIFDAEICTQEGGGGVGGEERDQTLLLNQRGAAACYQTSAHLKVVIFSPKTRQVVLYNLLSKNLPTMHDTRKDGFFLLEKYKNLGSSETI